MKLLRVNKLADVKLSNGVETNLTMLHVEIKDFYTMTNKMSSHETLDFLNGFLNDICPIIRQHGGFVDQYHFDGFSSLFSKNAHACEAALQIRKATEQYNQMNDFPKITTNISIHSANVLLGTVGESERMNGVVLSVESTIHEKLETVSEKLNANILLTEFALPKNRENIRSLGEITDRYARRYSINELFDPNDETKLETKQDFENGARAFSDKEYYAARASFERVLLRNHDDQVTNALYRMCKIFIAQNEADIDAMDLDTILMTPQLLEKLEIQAREEFSYENIDLWKHVEQYKLLKDQQARKEFAQLVYDKFVDPNSETCTNITEVTRSAIKRKLEFDNFELDQFFLSDLQREAKKTMVDTMKRFKSSPACRETFLAINASKLPNPL